MRENVRYPDLSFPFPPIFLQAGLVLDNIPKPLSDKEKRMYYAVLLKCIHTHLIISHLLASTLDFPLTNISLEHILCLFWRYYLTLIYEHIF